MMINQCGASLSEQHIDTIMIWHYSLEPWLFAKSARKNSNWFDTIHEYSNSSRTRTSWQNTVHTAVCIIIHRSSTLLIYQRGSWALTCETTVCQFYILSIILCTHLAKNTDTINWIWIMSWSLKPNLLPETSFMTLFMHSWNWEKSLLMEEHTH